MKNIIFDRPVALIEIAPTHIKRSRYNKFKTWFWNLILPPHIRLHMPPKDTPHAK